MKKLIPLFLSLALLLSGCGPAAAPEEDGTLHVAAMTYPIYLFTSRVIEGAEGVEAEAVINQPMSCLHDYTLTVNDMKAIQGADLLLLNGVGLEDACPPPSSPAACPQWTARGACPSSTTGRAPRSTPPTAARTTTTTTTTASTTPTSGWTRPGPP